MRRWVTLLLAVLGLLLVGIAIGRLALPIRETAGTPIVFPSEPAASAGATVTVPDVAGLAVVDARAALRDAGGAPEIVEKPTPYAGQPGLVINSDPAAGQAISGPVTLSVSEATTMPDLAGKQLVEARSALETLGAVVTVRNTVATQPGGTVLSMTPAAGAALPQAVELAVAVGGDGVFVGDLRPDQQGACSGARDVVVSGVKQWKGLLCRTSAAGAATQPFIVTLDKHALTLEGSAVVPDRPGQTGATLTIQADGQDVTTLAVKPGAAQTISMSLQDVRKLTIVIAGDPGQYVFLDRLRAVGTPEGIAALAAGTTP